MIADQRAVSDRIRQLLRRLDELTEWLAAPDGPFPADDVELGEFIGEIAVLLLSSGSAPGDGPRDAMGVPVVDVDP